MTAITHIQLLFMPHFFSYDVTPAEFMRYLANDEDAHRILKGDPHWNRYHLKCKPCIIDYDYYIRIETGLICYLNSNKMQYKTRYFTIMCLFLSEWYLTVWISAITLRIMHTLLIQQLL